MSEPQEIDFFEPLVPSVHVKFDVKTGVSETLFPKEYLEEIGPLPSLTPEEIEVYAEMFGHLVGWEL